MCQRQGIPGHYVSGYQDFTKASRAGLDHLRHFGVIKARVYGSFGVCDIDRNRASLHGTDEVQCLGHSLSDARE
jgi:hypothetical protein